VGENPQGKLQMPLGLHRAAHEPERHQRAAIANHGKAWNDGMERSFARADLVGVAGPQVESGPPILQPDPRAGNHDTRAEAHVAAVPRREAGGAA